MVEKIWTPQDIDKQHIQLTRYQNYQEIKQIEDKDKINFTTRHRL